MSLVAGLLLSPQHLAVAQEGAKPDEKKRIEQNERRLNELRKVIEDNKRNVAEVVRAKDQTDALVKASQQQLDGARAERTRAARQLLETTRETDRLKGPVQERAATLYMSGGLGEVSAVASIDDVESLLQRSEFIGLLAQEDAEELGDLARALEVARAAEERLSRAERGLADSNEELRKTQGLQAEAVSAAQAKIEEYQEEADDIEADSKRIEDLIKARTEGRIIPGTDVRLQAPVSCERTSGFGPRWGRMHEGMDFGCPVGTTVRAAAAGTVIEAGWSNGYGYLVLVDHGGGYVTAYAHNSRFVASSGARVTQGQTIAISGNTGRSTGPHVHFEVRVNGVARNPANYLA